MATNNIKRLILCCDGTWMDSDDGFKKPTLIPYVPTGTLQVPSNVTRISRALRRTGLDGVPQIIFYHSGVGTGSSLVDKITGGFLGSGISETIREVYSFIAANYTPGDEIVLIGFSRGAFTVRSVASIIKDIGLLTRDGMNDFYPIFKDSENFRTEDYHDIFPDIPFPDKPRGENAAHEYKTRLEKDGLTRVFDPDGNRIKIQAVAVWDTVGSLGIPSISLFQKLGFPHSTKEYKFYDTNISGYIRHAFQALALDEHRAPFQAAVWERANRHQTAVDLRQVWFPGAHSNVGGGYDDQEIANISLAWMMDQLASIGIAFQNEYIEKAFIQNVRYFENPPPQQSKLFGSREPQWAVDAIYEKHKPVRPWALGKIWDSKTSFWNLAGSGWRTPGLNVRADPDDGTPTGVPMQDTNERIHSCVRVRLELDGLGLDDKGLYRPHALEKKWRLRQIPLKVQDPIPWNANWGPGAPGPPEGSRPRELRWVWEYSGPEEEAPEERIMVEETLGPYERKLLELNKGRKFYKRYRRRSRRKDRRQSAYGEFTIEDDLIDDKAAAVRGDRPFKSEKGYRREKVRPADSENSLVDDRYVRPPSRPPEGPRYRDREEEVFVEKRRESRPPTRAPSRAQSRAPSRHGNGNGRNFGDIVVTEDVSDVERRRDGSRYRGENGRASRGGGGPDGYRGSFVGSTR